MFWMCDQLSTMQHFYKHKNPDKNFVWCYSTAQLHLVAVLIGLYIKPRLVLLFHICCWIITIEAGIDSWFHGWMIFIKNTAIQLCVALWLQSLHTGEENNTDLQEINSSFCCFQREKSCLFLQYGCSCGFAAHQPPGKEVCGHWWIHDHVSRDEEQENQALW